MIGLSFKILRILISLIFKVYQPKWLLRFDKWCENKLGLDIIKQERTFYERYPGITNRIQQLEKNAHPPIPIDCFDGYRELIKRIEKLEKK